MKTLSERLSPLWAPFHEYAWFYPANPTPEQKIKAEEIYKSWFPDLIFCPACKQHYLDMVMRTPPDVTSKDSLFLWTINRHNEVNARLNKPIANPSEVISAYNSGELPIKLTNSGGGSNNTLISKLNGLQIGSINISNMLDEVFSGMEYRDRVMWVVLAMIILVIMLKKFLNRIANFMLMCPI